MLAETEGNRPPDVMKRLLVLVIVLIAEALLLGGGYVYLLRVTTSRQAVIDSLEQKRVELGKSVMDVQDRIREIAFFNAQVAAGASVLDGHVHWTNVFDFLESKARPNVSFVNFSGEATGAITLDVVARTYRDVAEQIVALRDDKLVQDVRATTASARVDDQGNVTGVAFTMVVTLDPKIWTLPRKQPAPLETVVEADWLRVEITTPVTTSCDDVHSSCFSESFAACTPGKVAFAALGDLVVYKYEIIGLENSDCLMRSSFVKNPDPAFVGPTMDCPYDAHLGFDDAAAAVFVNDFRGCSGDLLPLLKEESSDSTP